VNDAKEKQAMKVGNAGSMRNKIFYIVTLIFFLAPRIGRPQHPLDLIENRDRAIQMVEDSIMQEPFDGFWNFTKGLILEHHDEFTAAIIQYELFLESPQAENIVNFHLAICNYQMDNCAAAIKYSTDYLESRVKEYYDFSKKEQTLELLDLRRTCKFRLGDIDGSILDLTRMIEYVPESSEIYTNRGWNYFKSEEYESALSDLNKALTLEATNTRALQLRGLIYLKLGQIEKGCRDWSRAGELGDARAYDLIIEYCN